MEVANPEIQLIHMPSTAKIVFVGSKSDNFVDIWAVVDEDDTSTRARQFQIFPTGAPIPEDAQYMGTSVQDSSLQNGNRVWHLFERLAD